MLKKLDGRARYSMAYSSSLWSTSCLKAVFWVQFRSINTSPVMIKNIDTATALS